jgi:hypothetical protein
MQTASPGMDIQEHLEHPSLYSLFSSSRILSPGGFSLPLYVWIVCKKQKCDGGERWGEGRNGKDARLKLWLVASRPLFDPSHG